MRTLLTLALTLLSVSAAAPAVADETYYCVEPVTVAVGAASRDLTTPAVCMYAPSEPTP
jgi:hypothetical protein